MSELTPQERAVIVTWALAKGRRLTTRQVADMTGLGMSAARELLGRISRVAPICQTGWLWAEMAEGTKNQHNPGV